MIAFIGLVIADLDTFAVAVSDSAAPAISDIETGHTFPEGSESMVGTERMAPYLGADSFRVVDMSPFPRECDTTSGTVKCVWQIQRAR